MSESRTKQNGWRDPEEFQFVGVSERITLQSDLAVKFNSVDHALDVVRLSAQGCKHSPACNAAVRVLVQQNHWTVEDARHQGYFSTWHYA